MRAAYAYIYIYIIYVWGVRVRACARACACVCVRTCVCMYAGTRVRMCMYARGTHRAVTAYNVANLITKLKVIRFFVGGIQRAFCGAFANHAYPHLVRLKIES